MKKGKISLKDLAKRVGVSVSTISMALRDHPRISDARKDEIKSLARELGYVPDPVLSSLSRYRENNTSQTHRLTIAWINCWEDHDRLRQYREFDDYWRGASDTAEKMGYELKEIRVKRDSQSKNLGETLEAENIQGILIPPHGESYPWNSLGLNWNKFCVVRFGFSVSELKTHVVGCDQMRCVELAVKKIAESGYRKIGYVSDNVFELKTNDNFLMGYLRGVELHPELAQIEPLFISESLLDVHSIKQTDEIALREWLASNELDVILTPELCLAKWLVREGYKIPEDMALVSTSVTEENGVDTGICQNAYEIGAVAVQVLVGRLQRNDLGLPKYCRRVLVEGSWVGGLSLPKIGVYE